MEKSHRQRFQWQIKRGDQCCTQIEVTFWLGKAKSCEPEIYQLDLENKTGIVSLEMYLPTPGSVEGQPPPQGYPNSQEKPESVPTPTMYLAECEVLCLNNKDVGNKTKEDFAVNLFLFF